MTGTQLWSIELQSQKGEFIAKDHGILRIVRRCGILIEATQVILGKRV